MLKKPKMTGIGPAYHFGCIAAFAVALTGCSSVDVNTFRAPDYFSNLRLPSMTAPVAVEPQKPIGADELVDNEGQCASAVMASTAPTPEAPGNDPVTVPNNPAIEVGGVALGMSECEVVKRNGPADKVDFGANERNERKVVLTYLKNVRPGIYTFAAGRLVSIDRVEVPPPPKPVKPARSVKPKPKPKPKPPA